MTINTFYSFQYSDDALLTVDGGHEVPSAAAVTCQGGRARLTLAAQCVTRSVGRCLQPVAVKAGVKLSCNIRFLVFTGNLGSALVLWLKELLCT